MIRWAAVIGTLVALVAALASMVGLTSAPSRHAPAIQLETKPAKPVKLTFA